MDYSQLVRVRLDDVDTWAVRGANGAVSPLNLSLGDLLALPVSEARGRLDAFAGEWIEAAVDLLPPVDAQEVWAAGVTYSRSRDGRIEESSDGSFYDKVYAARRPELFFKSAPSRVVTTGDTVGIRADSEWNVPEPELGLVVNRYGEIFGYVVGNDMSSRSIEGENPLYLPQAKVYDRACALSQAIVPVWLAPEGHFPIAMTIHRDGIEVFAGKTSTASIARDLPELAQWLVLAMDFPSGAVLLTGTGIVPDAEFTLRDGDVVSITIDGIGHLTNTVTTVGRSAADLKDHA